MANEERKRLTGEEGRALVRRWRQSQETKKAFCRRAGVGVHVLSYWIEREVERPGAVKATHGDFVVVSAPQETRWARSEQLECKPTRCGTAVLVLMPEASASQLAQMVRELLEEPTA
jgi:transposase-like protein